MQPSRHPELTRASPRRLWWLLLIVFGLLTLFSGFWLSTSVPRSHALARLIVGGIAIVVGLANWLTWPYARQAWWYSVIGTGILISFGLFTPLAARTTVSVLKDMIAGSLLITFGVSHMLPARYTKGAQLLKVVQISCFALYALSVFL